MSILKSVILAGGLCGLAASASAATVAFEAEFTIMSISGENGAGLSIGDTIHWQLIFDNGGGLESNSWSNSDLLSATATSGSYQATFSEPYFFSDPVVSTDAGGNVVLMGWVDGFDGPDSDFDTLGGTGVDASVNGLLASDYSHYQYDKSFTDSSQWTASVAAIPLPAGLPLLLAGLGGLALLRRRHG